MPPGMMSLPGIARTHFTSPYGKGELLVLALVHLVAAGCQNTTPLAESFAVDPASCPEYSESSEGKVPHEGYLRAHPDLTHPIVVKLRSPAGNPPTCPGAPGSEATCADLDAASATRQALNQKEGNCVIEAFGATRALA